MWQEPLNNTELETAEAMTISRAEMPKKDVLLVDAGISELRWVDSWDWGLTLKKAGRPLMLVYLKWHNKHGVQKTAESAAATIRKCYCRVKMY